MDEYESTSEDKPEISGGFDLTIIEPLEKVCWIHENNRGIVYNARLKMYVQEELPFYEMDYDEDNRKLLKLLNEELIKNTKRKKTGKEHLFPVKLENEDDLLDQNLLIIKKEELMDSPLLVPQKEEPIDPPPQPKKCRKASDAVVDSFWRKRGGEPIIDAECSICFESFGTIRTLLDHRRDSHSEIDMLTCQFCGLVYSRRTHISQHLFSEYNVYKCEKCTRSFRSSHYLETHRCGTPPNVSKYVAQPKVRISCERCSRVFVYESAYLKHEDKCARTAEKMCKKITPMMMSSDALLDHDYIQKPKCKKCKILFQSVIFLDEHYEDVHSNGGHKCVRCDTTYQNKRWFKLHVDQCQSEGIPNPTSNDPPVVTNPLRNDTDPNFPSKNDELYFFTSPKLF